MSGRDGDHSNGAGSGGGAHPSRGDGSEGQRVTSERPPSAVEAWESVARAVQGTLGALERDLRSRGLTLGDYDVLAQLSGSDTGRLRMSELSARIVLTRSGLTRLIDRMEQDRLVRREWRDDDRRGCDVTLTTKGWETFRRERPVHFQAIREHFACHLTADELRVLRRAGRKIADARRGGP